MYAWCFDHGRLHNFPANQKPWCTAFWVPFVAAVSTEEQAIEAKQASYGDARFFNDLPVDQRIKVIEIRETWAGAWTRKD